MARQYVVNSLSFTLTGPKTIIQIASGSTAVIRLLAASIQQVGSTTSTQYVAEIVRKTAAATVTSFTPLLLSTNDGASKAIGGAALTGVNASAEGTDGGVCWTDGANILGGWDWVPARHDIWVPPSGIIALVLRSGAISSGFASVVYEEMP